MSQSVNQLLNKTLDAINNVVLGKDRQVRLALSCLMAEGHLLIEDLPGMGKTTLAQALAKVLGLDYNRIQFTNDLLPSDVIGATIFDPNEGKFHFHPGPVFSQVVLADELNRATPKSQSALLEAMEEGQVTVEGTSHRLPEPFFVIATQNPASQTGTFPLPESQLDRFLMSFSLGYPDPSFERELLKGASGRRALDHLKQQMSPDHLLKLQAMVPKIQATDNLLDYVQRLVAKTRDDNDCQLGLSPRAALSLLRAAQAWALIHNRGHVMPEDVQAVFVPVAGHRLVGSREKQGDTLARHLLGQVDVVGS